MKKYLLATTLIIATGLSGSLLADAAAGGPAPGDRHERGMQRMAEALSLSSEQQEQIRQIREEQGAKFKTLREESKARIDAVLTAEQREKAAALHAERRERMKEHREHRDKRHDDKK